jgi:carboxypeptidase C (cathepsin A)
MRDMTRASAVVAATFYVASTVPGQEVDERPLTFLFNGGPGASSVFLHLDGVGPRMLHVNADGTLPPPVRLVDTARTWLSFTDVVCRSGGHRLQSCSATAEGKERLDL